MNTIIFDSGPLISLTMGNFLWLLEPLSRRFNGTFAITESVKHEVVDRPLRIKRFCLEALQILEKIEERTLTVMKDTHVDQVGADLLQLANSMFMSQGSPIHVVDRADMDTIALALVTKASLVVVDERVSRYLVDDPHKVRTLLEHRLHRRVALHDPKLHAFHEKVKHLHVVRSTEVVVRAFELGLLDHLLSPSLEHAPEILLSALLWKLKLNGASISSREIMSYKQLVRV